MIIFPKSPQAIRPVKRLAAALFCLLGLAVVGEDPALYLNPVALVASETEVYVALAGTRELLQVDVSEQEVSRRWPLPGTPSGMALSPDGKTLAMTFIEDLEEVVLWDLEKHVIHSRFAAGHYPVSPVYLDEGETLAVLNRFEDTVSLFRIPEGRRFARIPAGREPLFAISDQDSRYLYVGNHMPRMAATAEKVNVAVARIDLKRKRLDSLIALPDGSIALQGMTVSPDGSTVWMTHGIGQYQLPTNQLERGWVNTNAMSMIDAASGKLRDTVLLDDTTLGAANPWGVGVSLEADTVVVSHTGTHEISLIPLSKLEASFEEGSHGEHARGYDLTLMNALGRRRLVSGGLGPRELVVEGTRGYVLEYFSGTLAVLDLKNRNQPVQARISLGTQPEMDEVRHGELRFSDARLCFQHWQSCISCHPSIRVDGLNWDNLNDGLGNPKQTKSLLFSHETPPVMAHGVRATAEVGVRAGIRHIQFTPVDEEDALAMDAYLKQLRPVVSPYLVKGELSKKARRGEKIFKEIGCARCHSGEYYTDMKLHKVRHAVGEETRNRPFDTPTLREVWRTAPYLYDGRAATMEEALMIKSKGYRELSRKEKEALVEYVLSL